MEDQRNPRTPVAAFPEKAMGLPAGMSRLQFRAMGSTITLIVPQRHVAQAVTITQGLFAEWEQTLSRFRPESELSRLNSYAGRGVIVGPLLFRVLVTALAAAKESNGIYDPTMLTQLSELGYDRSFDKLNKAQPAQSNYKAVPGGAWRKIQLEPERRKVTLPAGVQLDFGGIAKGMAVDAALARLQQADIQPALVNAGGDLSFTGVPENSDHWSIAIPGRDGFWSLPMRGGAIATSGIAHRHWRQGEQIRHHLLDPRTGLPVLNGLWTVTCIAATCAQAEIAAKVAFILGSQNGKKFVQDHHLAGLFVSVDGKWTTGGQWPEHLMQKL